jgi:aryl-alcohol dehydrogenase-like predicted oxidoreductase
MTGVAHIDETVTIGGDLTVGRIGYGAMQLTGPKVWSEYPDHDKGVALLREVVASGVTYIDTADALRPSLQRGAHTRGPAPVSRTAGHRHQGRVRPQRPRVHRHGRRRDPYYLRHAAHMSARRLGLDHIDLYSCTRRR